MTLTLISYWLYSFSNKNNIKKPRKSSRSQFRFLQTLSRYDDWLFGLYFEREFEEVLLFAEKYPDKFQCQHNIQNAVGVCFLHLGDYENAIKCFQNAIQGKNNYALAHFNWALALYLQGKIEEAVEVYERASKTRGFPFSVYESEVSMLKEDLQREENKIFEDFIKKKIGGFEFFLQVPIKKITEG